MSEFRWIVEVEGLADPLYAEGPDVASVRAQAEDAGFTVTDIRRAPDFWLDRHDRVYPLLPATPGLARRLIERMPFRRNGGVHVPRDEA